MDVETSRGAEALRNGFETRETDAGTVRDVNTDPSSSTRERRFPIGAELLGLDASFRVWAPSRTQVRVLLHQTGQPRVEELKQEPGGYWSCLAHQVGAGQHYSYLLDDETFHYPDPASRYQPTGPHGPSMLVDPQAFAWTDGNWPGLKLEGQVIYELHVGTFTPEGTWAAAIERLNDLADLGITCIEVMPVADFSGEFGWGYDGVNWFAPTRLYGEPDNFRRFVNAAHELGIGVILDVVYNHFGPDGNYIHSFAKQYFSQKHKTDWGQALNFDDVGAGAVREFVVSNAEFWISEYHLDGLRLDATQNIYDSSTPHIITELVAAARKAAGNRSIIVVGENEEQKIWHVVPPEDGGFGLDALWNDDFHHSAAVALSGHSEAYYTDYFGSPQEFISALKWGYLYQGQWYKWQNQRRGSASLTTHPSRFVTFLENHDQIANSGKGERMHEVSQPGRLRALTGLFLLAPGTPMLFQGQEFAASSRFFYFAANQPDLAPIVAEGRREFLSQFPSLSSDEMQKRIPNPSARLTFQQSKLDWADRDRHASVLAMHKDLIQLRRTDPVLSQQTGNLDGAVISDHAFLIRFFADDGLDRLLLVNLGRDRDLSPAPEPLLAEPHGCRWDVLWCSEDPIYNGHGVPPLQRDNHWFIPGNAAVLLAATEMEET
jgi:maltooligosyltrehalose trehalohydrolase